VARSKAKEHALREINLIAQGSNPQHLTRDGGVPEMSRVATSAVILARAIGQDQRRGTKQ